MREGSHTLGMLSGETIDTLLRVSQSWKIMSLENLLQDPRVAASQYLYLQPNQPAAFMNTQSKWEAAGPKLSPQEVEAMLAGVIPQDKVSEPFFQLRVGVGEHTFDLKIPGDETGCKAQFQKDADAAAAPPP